MVTVLDWAQSSGAGSNSAGVGLGTVITNRTEVINKFSFLFIFSSYRVFNNSLRFYGQELALSQILSVDGHQDTVG